MTDDPSQAHLPDPDTQIDLNDEHDVAMWALVMRVASRAVREAAARVGTNVWAIWDEVRAHPDRYSRETDQRAPPATSSGAFWSPPGSGR